MGTLLAAAVLLLAVTGLALAAPRSSVSQKVTRQAKSIETRCDGPNVVVKINDVTVFTGQSCYSIDAQDQVDYNGQTITYDGNTISSITDFTFCGASELETVGDGDTLPGGGVLCENAPNAFYVTISAFAPLILTQLDTCNPPPTGMHYYSDGMLSVEYNGMSFTYSELPSNVSSSNTVGFNGMSMTITFGRIGNNVSGINNLLFFDAGGGVTSYGSSESITLSGAGLLFTSSSSSTAVYTMDPTVIQQFTEYLSSKFSFEYVTNHVTNEVDVFLIGNGMRLVQVSGAVSVLFEGVASATYQNGTVTFFGFDNNPATNGMFGGIAQLTIYDGTLRTYQESASGTISIDVVGGTGVFYIFGTSFFCTTNAQLKPIIDEAILNAPPPSYSFGTKTNNQGAAILFASPSGSRIEIDLLNITCANLHIPNSLFPIDDYYFSFQNGMLIVRDNSNQIIRVIERVEQVYVYDGPGTLRAMREGDTILVRCDKLYICGTQAFLTNQQDVINLIERAPGFRPTFQVIERESNSSNRVELELLAGGESVVSLTDSSIQTICLVNRDYTIIYDNNTIYVIDRGLRISTPFMYTASNIITEDGDTDPRLSGITDLYVYDGVNVTSYTGSSTELFQGGGVLYRSGSDGFYVANTDPFNSNAPLYYNPEELLMKVDIIYEIRGVKRLQVYDGTSLATYIGFSRNFIEEDGCLYVAGNEAFFSSSDQLNRDLVDIVSAIVPIDITANFSVGDINITINGINIISFAPCYRVSIKSTELFIYRNNTILYADSDVEVLPSNVMTNTLTVYDGISKTTYTGSAPILFQGQGVLYVDPILSETLYVKGADVVVERIDNLIETIITIPPLFRIPLEERVYVGETSAEADFGQDVTAHETANLTLLCTVVDSIPPPLIAFGFNDLPITASNNKYTVDIAPNGYTGSLTIHNLDANDDGLYECIAGNKAGISVAETRIVVNDAVPPTINPGAVVIFIPQIHQQIVQISSPTPVNVTYNIISEIDINCGASGRPRPDITWSADGATLAGNAEYNMTTPRPGFGVLEYDVTESLSTACVDYECRAENSAGVDTKSVTVCGERYSCSTTGSTDCSVTCGVGFIVQIFECQRVYNNMQPEILGNYSSIPRCVTDIERPAVMPCGDPQPPACPTIEYRYNYSDYSPCSVTCGRGIMQRTVDCVEVTRDGERPFAVISTEIVNDTRCIVAGQFLEETVQRCELPVCPVWTTGEFGSCSVTCGSGVRRRTVQCVERNTTNVLNDTACDMEVRPVDTMSCSAGSCPFLWGFSAWGECIPDCELGYHSRNVSCYDDSRRPRVIVDDELCSEAGEPPTNVSRCGSGPCQQVGTWLAGPFSDCSVTCGVGTQGRNVECVDSNYQSIDTIYCDPSWRPQQFKDCFNMNCPNECDAEHPLCPAVASAGLCQMVGTSLYDCCLSCPGPP